MISHIFLGITDFEKALAFYDPLMAILGLPERFRDPVRQWAGWSNRDGGRPLFLIGLPFDGGTASPGNGAMTALSARSRAEVDECHRIALLHGGRNEGDPGLRPAYHPNYYGAYVRDLDGNKLCFVCHEAQSEGTTVTAV